MLANLPKDKTIPSGETCALYCFPEISCRTGKADSKAAVGDQFVSGSFDRKDDDILDEQDLRNSAQVRLMIDEAFNNGLKQGRSEAIAAQQDRIDQAATALGRVQDEMARIRQQDVRQMEVETVRLALAIAKKIIGHESRHGQIVKQVVKSAMSRVADPRNMILKLNPGDIDTIQASRPEWMASDDPGAAIRIEPDESVQQGGCTIETQLGDVDARIDSQMKIIEEMLSDQLSQSNPKQ